MRYLILIFSFISFSLNAQLYLGGQRVEICQGQEYGIEMYRINDTYFIVKLDFGEGLKNVTDMNGDVIKFPSMGDAYPYLKDYGVVIDWNGNEVDVDRLPKNENRLL